MKTPLAWQNLLHNKVKTGAAIAGIVFAIVLMFMQLGFLEAVRASATIIYDKLDFDICIRSRDYLHLSAAGTFPRARLIRAASLEGVERTVPFTIAKHRWKNARSGEGRAILCFGVIPTDPVFRERRIQEPLRLLTRPDQLLIDTLSRREFGPSNGIQFGPADVGEDLELSGHRVTIAGFYTCGAGLSSAATAMLTHDGIRQATPYLAAGDISLGLLKTRTHADPDEVTQRLRQFLGDDVDVRSRSQVRQDEITHWVDDTNYGFMFKTGVVLALIVGTAIVYQVLSSDVASRLPEYATLKTMGYNNRFVGLVVLQQAVILALVGYGLGFVITELLYFVTSKGAQIPIRMTWKNALIVLVLSHGMCVASGLGALRKAFRADPADLF